MDLDRSALDDLFSATYEELRRLASRVKGDDVGATLSPTALVNEAWVKLARSRKFEAHSRLHFKRVAARAMRQVLVEVARRRRTVKRGGGSPMVTFDPALDAAVRSSEDVLALDLALNELHRLEPRQARVVELRFFGGLDLTETATALEVSEATVSRDWRLARAWLAHEIRSSA